MSVGNINFSTTTTPGTQVRTLIRQLEQVLNELNFHLGVMDQCKNSGVIDAYLQTKYGYASVADAQSGYDELNSLLSKLNTDASVTSVHAAILQAARKFG